MRIPLRCAGHRPIPACAGIGLHPAHQSRIIERRPRAAWFEVHTQNFATRGGQLADLDAIAANYPLSLHAVGLSLGCGTPPDPVQLNTLRKWVARLRPGLVSDHLIHPSDPAPLPYTQEALRRVIRNVIQVQDNLERQILLENPSRRLQTPDSTLSEAEFLAEVVLRTGCGLLLNINNACVSTTGLDAEAQLLRFVEIVPADSIRKIHLAGDLMWDLFATAAQSLGPLPTLIQWDTGIPTFDVLRAEAALADSIVLAVRSKGTVRAAG
jgi:uncharacterized protein (UPF0276 family)